MLYSNYTIGGELYHAEKGTSGIKARVHKYIDKIRTKTGKWRYIYENTKNYKKNKANAEKYRNQANIYGNKVAKARDNYWDAAKRYYSWDNLAGRTRKAGDDKYMEAIGLANNADMDYFTMTEANTGMKFDEFTKLLRKYQKEVKDAYSAKRVSDRLLETSAKAGNKRNNADFEAGEALKNYESAEKARMGAYKQRVDYDRKVKDSAQYKIGNLVNNIKTEINYRKNKKKKKKK